MKNLFLIFPFLLLFACQQPLEMAPESRSQEHLDITTMSYVTPVRVMKPSDIEKLPKSTTLSSPFAPAWYTDSTLFMFDSITFEEGPTFSLLALGAVRKMRFDPTRYFVEGVVQADSFEIPYTFLNDSVYVQNDRGYLFWTIRPNSDTTILRIRGEFFPSYMPPAHTLDPSDYHHETWWFTKI